MSDGPIVVIDNGSHTLKGGLAGKFQPSYTFPSHVTKYPLTEQHTKMYAGNDIVKSPKGSTYSKVFDNESNNIDWNGLEKLYQHLIYDKLLIDQDKHKLPHHIALQRKNKLYITNTPFTSNKNKSKMCQMLFEKFDCDGVYFGITSTCSLYANGKTTGLVVDSGYKSTYIAPVFEGYMLPLFAKKLNYGGFTVDTVLKSLINSRHRTQTDITLKEAEKIKIDTCYVKLDYPISNSSHSRPSTSRDYQINYALPDGKEIKMVELHSERYQAAELMFQPELYDVVKEEEALPYEIHQGITRGDESLYGEMFKNIILTGGNTMMDGMKERVERDVSHITTAKLRVKVHASPQRGYAAWTGASLMASHSEMKDIWITPDLYEEFGSLALSIRCF